MINKKSKVEIMFDGVNWTDVSTYIATWDYTGELNNQADKATINFVSTINATYSLRDYLPIRIYEGWDTTTDRHPFTGLITKISFGYTTTTVNAADEIYKLNKCKAIAIYNKETDPQAGVISAIAEDLIESIVGLTTTVEDSGTDITINRFECSDKNTILERVSALAKALDWILLYDPEDDKVYFVSRGYFSNPNVLDLDNDIIDRAKWSEDSTLLFNDLIYKGGVSSSDRTKLFSGDGITYIFEVDLIPSDSVSVNVYVGGIWVEQVCGTPGVSSTYDYYIDKPNKKIVFAATSIPASDSDNVQIKISAQIPPIVHLRNEESIALYNRGTLNGSLLGIEETIIENDVTNNADAEVRARKLLDVRAFPYLSTTVTLKPLVDKLRNYKLGELVYVNDSARGFSNKPFIITSINRVYPGGGSILTLGDKAYRLGQIENDIMSRINRLESQTSGDYDILADFRYSTTSMELIAKSVKVTVDSIAGDYGIWDHTLYGIWDTSKWAPDSGADTGGFILGHTIYGVLGSAKLGASSSNQTIIDDEDYE